MIPRAVAVLCIAAAALAQDCPPSVEEATDPHLRQEVAHRGWSRWGCWATVGVVCRWTAPTEGSPVMYYILRVRGWGSLIDIEREYRYVFSESLLTWWPSWTDSVAADVCGVDSQGRQGPWSALSDTLLVQR